MGSATISCVAEDRQFPKQVEWFFSVFAGWSDFDALTYAAAFITICIDSKVVADFRRKKPTSVCQWQAALFIKKGKEFHNSRLFKHPIPRLNKGRLHCVRGSSLDSSRHLGNIISRFPGCPSLPGLPPHQLMMINSEGWSRSLVQCVYPLCSCDILWSGIPAQQHLKE